VCFHPRASSSPIPPFCRSPKRRRVPKGILVPHLAHVAQAELTVTISSISCREMYPFPSKSYIEKAHFNFCSNFPLDVTLSAQRNSRKSIVPSPLASNVRKTCSANYRAKKKRFKSEVNGERRKENFCWYCSNIFSTNFCFSDECNFNPSTIHESVDFLWFIVRLAGGFGEVWMELEGKMREGGVIESGRKFSRLVGCGFLWLRLSSRCGSRF
jgi:hypothetical protein